MRNYQTLDEEFETGLNISANMRESLRQIARWAYFLSVLGFILVGFIIGIAIFSGTLLGVVLNEMQEEFPGIINTLFITVIYLFIALISFFPVLFLYRFSVKTKNALRTDNRTYLESALKNLKSHYKFIGFLALALIGVYALLIFLIIIASISN